MSTQKDVLFSFVIAIHKKEIIKEVIVDIGCWRQNCRKTDVNQITLIKWTCLRSRKTFVQKKERWITPVHSLRKVSKVSVAKLS